MGKQWANRNLGKNKNPQTTHLRDLRTISMVRVMGLEPIRQRHTPLKRACLPIPAHSLTLMLIYYIIPNYICQELLKFFCEFFINFAIKCPGRTLLYDYERRP